MELSGEKRKLLERLRNPRFRPREGYFLVEGVRGSREILRPSLPLSVRFALVSPRLGTTEAGRELGAFLDSAPFPVFEVPDDEMKGLSDTSGPQGVLMVVEEPEGALAMMEEAGVRQVLLLDGIQDPGNVGGLIRAAHAFGITGVVALDGTADPWGPKVVRASAGSLAHTPVARLPWREAQAWLETHQVSLIVADAGGENLREHRTDPPWGLVVGNEGAGPRQEILEVASKVIAIPMAPGADSLNAGAAGAIALYALTSPSVRPEHQETGDGAEI